MELCDYHIHSICSEDGHYTMAEMALSSYKAGVRRMCITDHCDLDDYMTGYPKAGSYDHRERAIAMYKEALAQIPADMELYYGMELGEGRSWTLCSVRCTIWKKSRIFTKCATPPWRSA